MKGRGWTGIAAALLVLALAGCAPAANSSAFDARPPADERADAADTRWVPAPATSWQWQLTGALDLTVEADVFDVDYETTTRAEIAALKAKERRTICYLSVGSWEEFRGDADTFPISARGNVMSGWPDEKWLDIRRLDVLLPIMAARMDICVAKGFDAVEPDNVDGYLNETGFPLTAGDQLSYNRAVAGLAHSRGLSVALKNDIDQIPDLVDDFDFAVNEECVKYTECDQYQPFTDAGKAVLHVEYEGSLGFCAEARQLGLSSMRKPLDLGPARDAC